MKNAFRLVLVLVLTLSITIVFGQITTVNNNVNLSKFASAIGKDNSSTGYYSTAIGRYNLATGNGSFSFGFTNNTVSDYSVAIGSYLKTTGNNSIIIGSGLQNTPMENYIANSVMIGGFSNLPTLLVIGSSGMGTTGQVGIGNTGLPLAKLHLRADEGEDAAIFIQPYNWLDNQLAYLRLGDGFHGISANERDGLFFNTSSYYNFNEGYLKIGKDARTGYVLVCADDDGTARWAPVELPDPSPWTSLETGDIYFNGGNSKVGIGTINNTSFALAVQGSIITDEVMVRVQEEWYDFVLKPDYKLMPLNQLSEFISQHHHLPDVPSEDEVTENGFGLAEMNGILLKKVEELTLYILEQQKVLETQREELNMIKEKLGN